MTKASLAALIALLPAAACSQAPGAPATETTTATTTTFARAQDDASPGRFARIDAIGDGCQDSTTSVISPDGQAFTSIFSAFVAAAGPGVEPERAMRGCLLLATVEVPPGWSYSMESIDLRGFAGLEDDVTASLRTVYVVPGNPVQSPPARRFEGEISDDYFKSEVSPGAPSGWSPCGQGEDLWMVVQTEVDNDGDDDAGGQLTVDSVDGELQWRRCN